MEQIYVYNYYEISLQRIKNNFPHHTCLSRTFVHKSWQTFPEIYLVLISLDMFGGSKQEMRQKQQLQIPF